SYLIIHVYEQDYTSSASFLRAFYQKRPQGEDKEKRCDGGHGRAAIPVPQTGFKGPFPSSTSSPAPTIHGLGEQIRRIVGASGVWSGREGPCGRPSVP